MSVALRIRRCSVALLATLLASAGLYVASAPPAFAVGPVVSIGSSSIFEGNAGNRTLYFNVTLSETSASPVTVHYATSPTTATANTDYVTKSGNLTIGAGGTTNWVMIAVKGDVTNEADETFKVTLSAPTNATLGAQSIGTGTIKNDDNPSAAGVEISIASASMTEGNTANRIFWFSIALSKTRTSPTTIHYATAPATALAGVDYTTRSANATIPAGQLATFGNVVELPDVFFESGETFKVTLSAPPSGVTVKGGPAIATIVDDDPRPANAQSWGNNALGGLGDPSVATNTVRFPRQVTGMYAMASSPAFSEFGMRTLAVGLDGKLWGWGENDSGELGDGSIIDHLLPEQIGTDTDWSAVSAGTNHTLAVKTDGTLWACGDNSWGELGDGSAEPYSSSPVQVGSGTDWARASAGQDYSLGVKTDGTLWAFGNNGSGRLGTGDSGTITYHDVPTQVGTAVDWASTSAGVTSDAHSVAVKTDGTLWTWGSNLHGELGTDYPNTHDAPTQVGSDTDWATASAGYLFTLAVRTGGTLWAFGANDTGQLGTGDAVEYHVPTQVGTGTNWAMVSAGTVHGLAVTTGGALWAWGNDDYRQLGDNSTATKLAPQRVGSATGYTAVAASSRSSQARKSDGTVWELGYNRNGQLGFPTYRADPGAVATAGPWKAIAPEDDGGLGIKANGTLWGWGQNDEGQLGDGTGAEQDDPVQIGTANSWTRIAGGSYHTLAVRSNGTLWAWGQNIRGQVGDGTTTDRHTPTQIGSDTHWKSVAAGGGHSLAIKTDGTLWAWGSNSRGQLGDGTTNERHVPTKIGTLTTWKQVAAGADHSMAIRTDGTLWAWGNNSSGQLGDGTTTARHAPKQIGTATTWKQVATCGLAFHTAAVTSYGGLWAWGSNSHGQLGNSGAYRTSPTRVGTANDWDAVAVGDFHTVGLRGDRSVWAMGRNNLGQLGNGSTTNSMAPVLTGAASHANQVATCGDATFVLSDP